MPSDYPIKVGTFVHTDGSSYTCPPSLPELVSIVEHGNLLDLTDDLEVWIHKDKAAIVYNALGVLE